jgi:sulfur carrier protein
VGLVSPSSRSVAITVNGASRSVDAGMTVAGLLAQLGVTGRVAVERNREVIPRAEHAQCVLAEGDQIEVVTFVGGG